MTVIKKYAAITLRSTRIDNEVKVDLSYGGYAMYYPHEESPEEEFDTEQEAIEYAYEKGQYLKWLIVPVIRFEFEMKE